MRTIRLAAIAAGLLLTVGTSMAAQPTVGILACGRGTRADPTVCGVGGCTGAALLTGALVCPQNSALTVLSAKLQYLQGVCGDQPALPGLPAVAGSCGNFFWYYSEACTDPAGALTQGTLLSVPAWGRYRFCYDSTGAGDCTGAVPAGLVISSGSYVNFGRETVGDGPRTEIGDARRVTQAPFSFNGVTKNMYFKIASAHYTTELSTTSCAGGCGFEGCMFKLK